MNGTVTGTVVNVTDAKIYAARRGNTGNQSISKDYYHVTLQLKDAPATSNTQKEIKDIARELHDISNAWKRGMSSRKTNTFARVYYPVVANVSNRTRSVYDKKTFTHVMDARGNWIPYQVSNPKLLVGKTIEVTGEMKIEDNGDYYINRIQTIKIFDA